MKRLMIACVLVLSACGGNVPPETSVAIYGTNLLQAATALQRGVTQMTESKLLPVPLAQKITDQIAIIDQKAPQMSNALKAYHAATTALDRQSKAALVQSLIEQLNSPLAAILGVAVPPGAVTQLTKLVANTMAVVSAIQMEVAKGLGGPAQPPQLSPQY